jgi:hypothetical protein
VVFTAVTSIIAEPRRSDKNCVRLIMGGATMLGERSLLSEPISS